MDFFGAEERARKRTSRLLLLFILAILGTVAGGYFGSIFILGAARARGVARIVYRMDAYGRTRAYAAPAAPGSDVPLELWQPRIFAGVSLATLAVVGLASLYKWSSLRGGGGAVAESVGARRIDPHTTDTAERRLLNVVEEMAIAAGIPVPSVYLLEDEPGINAFAAGLTRSDAIVTVTRGALQTLTRDELQGVIGHEFSHILNGDMRLNLHLTALLFGILILGLAGRGVLWSLRFGGLGRSRDDRNGNGGMLLALGFGLLLLVIGYIGYFFGRLIQAAVSRQREFLADAASVQFTRNPAGITGALKKIGGYAPGSTLRTNRAAQINHFFFAQGFRSSFGGLWATHPPLEDRIRAVDEKFDGKFISPSGESAPGTAAPAVPPFPATSSPAFPFSTAPAGSGSPANAAGTALIASAGTLTAEAVAGAQELLANLPGPLRAAAQSAHDAPLLLYGLLLDGDPAVRARQKAAVAARNGGDALHSLEELEPALRQLKPEDRLPLLQLTLPALKGLPPDALRSLAAALDDLVRADGKTSPFEFALQKLVFRTLAINRAPWAGIVQIYSFQAVADEISAVLSALAHASSANGDEAARAFAEGAAQLKLLEGRLVLLAPDDGDFSRLDAALDKLATASGPIKQRLLVASVHVVTADGRLLVEEAELLRAVAGALDVPMPRLPESAHVA